MGDRTEPLRLARRTQARRAQQMTLIYAVMVCLVILIFLQLLLLVVAVEGFQGAHRDVVIPATIASGLCFAGGCWLIRYVLFLPASGTKDK